MTFHPHQPKTWLKLKLKRHTSKIHTKPTVSIIIKIITQRLYILRTLLILCLENFIVTLTKMHKIEQDSERLTGHLSRNKNKNLILPLSLGYGRVAVATL